MHRLLAGVCTAALAASVISAQESRLPSQPLGHFGGSITGAFDGWYRNADGTRAFLVGYYNRNTAQALDIPVGPNNRIEPGGPDMGQPTHFLPGRNVGMFTVAVPKTFTDADTLTWTIVANGQATKIPLRVRETYFVSPLGGETVDNTPPQIRFVAQGPRVTGPVAATSRAINLSTSVGVPLPLTIWADDDARYTSGTNAPMRNPPPPVAITWSKYRGPGDVRFAARRPALEVLAGGHVAEPYSGKGTTTATFTTPGEYMLHALVTDYSGPGGNGEVCCWTTAIVRVVVSQ